MTKIGFVHDPPVKSVSLAVQVYKTVRRAVIEGQLAPGLTLSEAGLAHELGVSRTPVREAVRRLQAEGFIVRKGEDGLTVPTLSKRELRNLYSIRSRLEGLAAGEAAQNATASGIRDLEQALERTLQAYEEGRKAEDLVSVGTEFHRLIAVLSQNALNLELLENIMSHVRRYRLLRAVEAKDVFLDDHARIVSAIVEGNAEVAEALMTRHVEHGFQEALAGLDERIREEKKGGSWV